MKMKNIPPDIKSKSINEAKSEIVDILSRLEMDKADLEASKNDYERHYDLQNDIKVIMDLRRECLSHLKHIIN